MCRLHTRGVTSSIPIDFSTRRVQLTSSLQRNISENPWSDPAKFKNHYYDEFDDKLYIVSVLNGKTINSGK